MRHPLPYKDFRFLTEEEIQDFDVIKNITDQNGPGYVCQVDLEYPPELHLRHNAFPLAPENKTITKDILSPTSLHYLGRLPQNKGTYKSKKLTATFDTR